MILTPFSRGSSCKSPSGKHGLGKSRGELGDQDAETLSIAELAERKRTGISFY